MSGTRNSTCASLCRVSTVLIDRRIPGFVGWLVRSPLGNGRTRSAVALELEAAAIPFLPGALECSRLDVHTGGEFRNREWAGANVTYAPGIDPDVAALLFDPQTSGGLLLAARWRESSLRPPPPPLLPRESETACSRLRTRRRAAVADWPRSPGRRSAVADGVFVLVRGRLETRCPGASTGPPPPPPVVFAITSSIPPSLSPPSLPPPPPPLPPFLLRSIPLPPTRMSASPRWRSLFDRCSNEIRDRNRTRGPLPAHHEK